MKRYIVLGALLIAGFVVWNLPASMLRSFTQQLAGAEVVATRGSLWDGSGTLVVAEQGLGTLVWTFRPASLLSLSLGWDMRLQGTGSRLSGDVAFGLQSVVLNADGVIAQQLLNATLAPYDISIEGDVTVSNLVTRWDRSGSQRLRAADASGTLTWPGGRLQYPDGRTLRIAELPGLVGSIERKEPSAQKPGLISMVVTPQDSATPVLHGSLLDNGNARIGITKLLTKLLGQPWRGSDPDHAIVLELEEQLL